MNHATRPLRLLSIVTALALLAPQAQAAPADDQQALAVFEAGFKEGQAKFDDGEFLAAARAWIAAARNLRETQSNRDNRAAVYEYVVDAFTSGLEGVERPEVLREAVAALNAYCEGFTRAYGTETPISAKIIAARDDFKARLALAEAANSPKPEVEGPAVVPAVDPPAAEPKPTKRWKGLVISGGVLTGLGVGAAALAAATAARSQVQEDEYLDAGCLTMTTMSCQEKRADGEASNTLAVGSVVVAAPLLAVGVALLVVGLKRRSSSRTAFAPALAPGFAGLGLSRSF
jgi:uncharacterized protein with FMN-binding domain